MKFYTLLFFVLIEFACITALFADSPDEITELIIDVTKEVPASKCDVKTKVGDALLVHYDGYLLGKSDKFDSSRDRGSPFKVVLGEKRVIQGWEAGLLDMCQGEQRRLTIPPSLAYGSRGSGRSIPPNSVLVFDIELLDLRTKAPPEKHAWAYFALVGVAMLGSWLYLRSSGQLDYEKKNN